LAELAEILRVSKQRVSELAGMGQFPRPIAELKAGPGWDQGSIGNFLETGRRTPGVRDFDNAELATIPWSTGPTPGQFRRGRGLLSQVAQYLGEVRHPRPLAMSTISSAYWPRNAGTSLTLEWAVRCVSLFEQVPDPATVTGARHLARLSGILRMRALEASWLQVNDTVLLPA